MSTEKSPEAQGDMGREVVVDDNLELALQLYLDKEKAVEELEAKYDAAKKYAAIAEKSLIDKMLEQGVENFRALGYSVTRTEFVRASVLAEHRAQQIEWLRENGYGAMVTEAVNSQSFGTMVRGDFVKTGREGDLPTFVKIYREPRLLKRSVG